MRLLTVSQTAKRLAVSESTIRRMLTDPFSPLRGAKVHRGCVRVVEESIVDVIEHLTLKKCFMNEQKHQSFQRRRGALQHKVYLCDK